MIELAMFIAFIIMLMVTRKMWGAYAKAKTEDVHLAIEDARNEQQAEMKRIHDEREALVKQNGKWFTLTDIYQLASK